METAKKPKLELVKRKPDLTYKIVIPQEVEKKIRLLCTYISEVEWSGVLFYKVEGGFNDEENPLTINCVDIFQMDKGSSAYTEFNMSPDVVTYMVYHPELLEPDVYQGLIHSHNRMSTFFSATDTATLNSEGEDMAHFVSLIVNNAGTYSAAVTRRYKAEQKVNETYVFPTWGDKEVTGTDNFDASEEYIEWFPLVIEKEEIPVDEVESELIARMSEVETNKAKSAPKYSGNKSYNSYEPGSQYRGYNSYNYNGYGYGGYKQDTPLSNTPSGPAYNAAKYPGTQAGGTYVPVGQYGKKEEPQVKNDIPFEGIDYNVPYESIHPDKYIVDWLVKQVITGSIIFPSDNKLDITKWAQHMDDLYKKRFTSVKEFENFAMGFIDFLVNYTTDETIVDFVDDAEMAAILAYNLKAELEALPTNVWLTAYIKFIDDYII